MAYVVEPQRSIQFGFSFGFFFGLEKDIRLRLGLKPSSESTSELINWARWYVEQEWDVRFSFLFLLPVCLDRNLDIFHFLGPADAMPRPT